MKLKNKLFIGIGILVFIILIFFVFRGTQQTMLGQIDHVQTNILANNDEYVSLTHTAIATSGGAITDINCNGCKLINNKKVGKIYITQNLPDRYFNMDKMPTIATEENYYNNGWKVRGDTWIHDIDFNKYRVYNGYVGDIKLNDVDSKCTFRLNKRVSHETVANPSNPKDDKSKYYYYKLSMNCYMKGWFYANNSKISWVHYQPNSHFFEIKRPSTAHITVKILKDSNIICLDNKWCDINQSCINNKCVEIINSQTTDEQNNVLTQDEQNNVLTQDEQVITTSQTADKYIYIMPIILIITIFLIIIIIIKRKK